MVEAGLGLDRNSSWYKEFVEKPILWLREIGQTLEGPLISSLSVLKDQRGQSRWDGLIGIAAVLLGGLVCYPTVLYVLSETIPERPLENLPPPTKPPVATPAPVQEVPGGVIFEETSTPSPSLIVPKEIEVEIKGNCVSPSPITISGSQAEEIVDGLSYEVYLFDPANPSAPSKKALVNCGDRNGDSEADCWVDCP